MRKRGRVWRVGKWGGLAGCLAIAVVWVLSARNYTLVQYEFRDSSCVGVQYGCFFVNRIVGLSAGAFPDRSGWFAIPALPGVPAETRWGLGWPSFSRTPASDEIGSLQAWNEIYGLPLWVPFVILSLGTLMLWYADRRRIPAGHCQRCGYDLTKNESGTCPECGIPTGKLLDTPKSPS